MWKIRPHLVRYWLHSTEKIESPETFAEKVNEICSVYHNAVQTRERGLHTISVDEMTGIQASGNGYTAASYETEEELRPESNPYQRNTEWT